MRTADDSTTHDSRLVMDDSPLRRSLFWLTTVRIVVFFLIVLSAILVQVGSGAEVEISYLYGLAALAFVLSLFHWTVGRFIPPRGRGLRADPRRPGPGVPARVLLGRPQLGLHVPLPGRDRRRRVPPVPHRGGRDRLGRGPAPRPHGRADRLRGPPPPPDGRPAPLGSRAHGIQPGHHRGRVLRRRLHGFVPLREAARRPRGARAAPAGPLPNPDPLRQRHRLDVFRARHGGFAPTGDVPQPGRRRHPRHRAGPGGGHACSPTSA